MRLLFLVTLVFISSGCTNPMCIGLLDVGKKTYSPYYELEEKNDSGLLVRIVTTLGAERVPKNYPNPDTLYKGCSDGLLPGVSEVYFINTSDVPITIEPIKLAIGNSEKSFSGAITIQPGQWYITEPLINIAFNYNIKTEASVEYVQSSNKKRVEGISMRMTTNEVKEKYQPK